MGNDKKRLTLSDRIRQYESSGDFTATDGQWLEISPVGREFGSTDYETFSCAGENLSVIAPGEILKKEFMDPQGITAEQIAGAVDLPLGLITQILNGTQAINDDVAVRLGLFFQTESAFWINLQRAFDTAKRIGA